MRTLSLIIGLLFSQLSFAQLHIKVIGHVTGDTEGHNMVYLYNQLSRDSAEIKDGRFEVSFQESEIGTRAISLAYDRAKMRMFAPVVLFFDQSGVIEVEFDIVKGLSSARLSGMPSAVTYADYNAAKSKVFMQAHQETLAKFGQTAMRQDDERFAEANTFRGEQLTRLNDSLLNVFVDGDKMVSATLILSQAAALPVDRLEYYYSKLGSPVQESVDGQTLYAKIQGLKNAYIGAVVKSFELPDEMDKLRSFEEFKGKYVLLDFWASWCAPCRASFPRIREVYSLLKDKDFIIVNISIDRNKDAWLRAVEEEANPWPQLYDDRKVAYEFFNVSAVPTSYLIDPQGEIIMKEIGFDPKGGGKMELKLEEIFNVKF